ncbi:ParM/StbA family protein [Thermoflavimicrobium daqui]|uniref:Uncharacterized protein n=1 Tax=Thermoflavimicrobium daqui TaxID=2137476 RepID=A0A364K1K6_9BACL|nr:ParM/StbA family protein [Thermoflavimicrobium daqui]RAL21918.1 hypothetical protein DL897_15110 [Thermoflavimicrobium daqui]
MGIFKNPSHGFVTSNPVYVAYPILGLDVGNKDIKSVFETLRNTMKIPNILAPMPEKRDIINESIFTDSVSKESKKDLLLENIHFYIDSPAVSREFNRQFYAAGKLATEQKTKWEIREKTKKHDNDQIIINALVTAAIRALEYFKVENNTVHSKMVLSISLPVDETKNKEEFKSKFKDHKHTIKFLDVPHFQNITVYLEFPEVYTPTECLSGIIDLSIAEETNVHIADSSLIKKKILVPDFGGGTFDLILVENGKIKKARTHKIGINEFIQQIMDEFESKHDFAMTSREKVVERMKDLENPYQYKVYGRWVDFKDIAMKHFFACAQSIYTIIDSEWKNTDDIDLTLWIGGGSIPTKSHLQTINNDKYAFKFVDPIPRPTIERIKMEEQGREFPRVPDEEIVIYLNARGNYKLARRMEKKRQEKALQG